MNAAPELLKAAVQGDEQACEQMLRENSGLIWSIVRRYYGRGVEPDDLYQLGCLGFIKAIKGFNFAFGTQFSTYAVPKIAGEIRRFLRDDGAIKVSRSMREQAATIFAAREKLKNTLGREPALSELSEETGFNAEEIAQCELAVAAPDSLQRETGDGLTLEGMLGGESPEDGLIERIALREAIDELPEREKMTILLRFFKGLTQEQAAERLGKSQSAIANKLRLLQLTTDQRQFVLDNGLTERHARAVLRLPENRRSEALITIAKRRMNARQTDLYIEQVLNAAAPGRHRISMVKDVRIFVNTIDHAIRLMTDNGVPATAHREERDGYIEYTVRIPTAAAQR